MITIWHRVANFVGALLLLAFLVFCLLTTFLGGSGDDCSPPRGADCGGTVIGPVALLTGRPSFWDVPATFALVALGVWLVLRGYRPKSR